MKLRNTIDKTIRQLLIVLMSAIVIDVLLQVISRYLFRSPLGFTDELAGYLLIWLGLLGAAYATGEKQHLAIDLLSAKLSGPNQKRLELFISFLVICFGFGVLVIGGSWLIYTSFLLGQISASLEVPLGYIYLIVPISGILIVYYTIDNMIHQVRRTTPTSSSAAI